MAPSMASGVVSSRFWIALMRLCNARAMAFCNHLHGKFHPCIALGTCSTKLTVELRAAVGLDGFLPFSIVCLEPNDSVGLQQVYALETVVCNPLLGYAGTTDCVAR
jgi:hypothetical protein